MVPIPEGLFVLANPHPYVKLGAPYNGASPWMLREGMLAALTRAQKKLQKRRPGWKFYIADAYRPNSVQTFMVRLEYREQARKVGWSIKDLVLKGHQGFGAAVHSLWAMPTKDPAQPPPHSTGAVVDISFADRIGRRIFMGSPIDENSDRSRPDFFKDINPVVHARRQLLKELLIAEGLTPLKDEWWDFCLKTQRAAYDQVQAGNKDAYAIYGCADLLSRRSRTVCVPV